jgi:transposase-like protein
MCYNESKELIEMTLIEFNEKYGTEEQCIDQLYNNRWSDGFVCPKCEHAEYFDVKSRKLYQCKSCKYQASVTAGTIMDKTRTPLRKWFLALYLMSEDKRGISALSMKDKIGVAYNTAWTICHKIRHAMGERDEAHKLNGIVELDEAFFGSPTEGGKRGRGTDKTAVFVSVSLTKDGNPEYTKMKVVESGDGESVDGETVKKFMDATVAKGSEIHTDGLNIYNQLSENGYTHERKEFNPKSQPEHLHWTHIIISNAKALIQGTFHGLDSMHLQRYLNEFCYRFNRRWFKSGVFNRLIKACAQSTKITYNELIG